MNEREKPLETYACIIQNYIIQSQYLSGGRDSPWANVHLVYLFTRPQHAFASSKPPFVNSSVTGARFSTEWHIIASLRLTQPFPLSTLNPYVVRPSS